MCVSQIVLVESGVRFQCQHVFRNSLSRKSFQFQHVFQFLKLVHLYREMIWRRSLSKISLVPTVLNLETKASWRSSDRDSPWGSRFVSDDYRFHFFLSCKVVKNDKQCKSIVSFQEISNGRTHVSRTPKKT